MRYYMDFEFRDEGNILELISGAIVAEDGRQLYFQNTEYRFQTQDDWIWRNVYPHLTHFNMYGSRSCTPVPSHSGSRRGGCALGLCAWRDLEAIKLKVLEFCDEKSFGRPEFWTYFGAHDWVLFCSIFGKMVNLPEGWPRYANDIKHLQKALESIHGLGGLEGPPKPDSAHSALADAFWIRDYHKHLQGKINSLNHLLYISGASHRGDSKPAPESKPPLPDSGPGVK